MTFTVTYILSRLADGPSENKQSHKQTSWDWQTRELGVLL